MDPQEAMDRREKVHEKLSVEKARIGGVGAQMAINEANATKAMHPREVLMNEINDQEQRLLDKLAAIRELKREYMLLGRDEAERILKLSRLAEQLMR